MNDDLNLLITFLSNDNTMVKTAICVPHGKNLPEWELWRYFREDEVDVLLRNSMNLHVSSFCKTLLAVDIIFDIKGKQL